MKKWYKLSLASLVVPATAGVALVSVGCPSNTEGIPTPTLVDNPTVSDNTIDKYLSPEQWWNGYSLGSNPASTMDMLSNKIFKDSAAAIALESSIKSVEFVAYPSDTTMFEIKITLNDGKTFSDNSSSWTSGPIQYIAKVSEPTLKAGGSVGGSGTAAEWVNQFNANSNPDKFTQVLGTFTPGSIQTVTCATPNEKNEFNVTVTLKKGFQFSNGTNTWKSPGTLVFAPANNPINTVPTVKADLQKDQIIYGSNQNVNDWFSTLKDKQAIADTFFDAYSELKNVSKIDLVTYRDGSFGIQLTAVQNYYFVSNNSTTWTSTGWHYDQQLAVPEAKQQAIEINSVTYKNAIEWFASFNDATDAQKTLQNQYKELNQLFTFDTADGQWDAITSQKTDTGETVETVNVTKIKSIAINDNEAEHSFTFTLTMNDGYVVGDQHENPWTSPAIKYSLLVPTLKYALEKPLIAAPYQFQTGWWGALKDTNAQVNAINQLFTPETKLVPEKVDQIGEPNFIVGGAGKKCDFSLTLKSGYVFDDEKRTNEWSATGIDYVPTYQTPTVPAKAVGSETTLEAWLKNGTSGKSSADQFNWLNENLFVTKIVNVGDMANNSKITITLSQDKTSFTLEIDLPNGSVFAGTTESTWKSGDITYSQPQIIKTPTIDTTSSNVHFPENPKTLTNGNTEVVFNWLKENATNLVVTLDQVESAHASGTQWYHSFNYTIVLTLKRGYAFKINDQFTQSVVFNCSQLIS